MGDTLSLNLRMHFTPQVRRATDLVCPQVGVIVSRDTQRILIV